MNPPRARADNTRQTHPGLARTTRDKPQRFARTTRQTHRFARTTRDKPTGLRGQHADKPTGLRGQHATNPQVCADNTRQTHRFARTTRDNAGWSSPVARQAHNLKVTGSNPVPATHPHKPIPPTHAKARPKHCRWELDCLAIGSPAAGLSKTEGPQANQPRTSPPPKPPSMRRKILACGVRRRGASRHCRVGQKRQTRKARADRRHGSRHPP